MAISLLHVDEHISSFQHVFNRGRLLVIYGIKGFGLYNLSMCSNRTYLIVVYLEVISN